ncbi:FkbM family methyltransferase [Acuticoccus sediminis]|uniref:FkbM family methyltransferase n=1 Tax=Acuticoccus sediminis TaxID=2184697 RepID=UPI001CFDE149|nr:FkbM family methyltransferase [Acuticoccus sediminis]
METLDTLYGRIAVPDWPDDLIVRALRTLGEWGAAEVQLLAPLIEPGEVLFDVGAFLGTFAIGVAQLVPLGRIVAIEADETLRRYMTNNVGRNVTCPFEAPPYGVARSDGWIAPASMEDPGNHGAQSFAVTGRATPGAIPCLGLRSLRRRYGDYDVLKLDIEGLEEEALRGDLQYMRDRRPVIWMECNEDPRCLGVLEVLRWLDYEPYYLAFPAFRRANFRNSTDLIYEMAYEAALVAAPPERFARYVPRLEGEDIICRSVLTGYDLRRAMYDTPRYAQPDWLKMNRAELIGRLGHIERGIHLIDFLKRT